MMPLELNPSGVLSVSVHDTTLDTIELLFGQARRSTRRVTLFAKLKEYVTELRSAQIRGSMIVDGSFVMGCVEEPDDIDIVLVLASDWDLKAELRPFQYNLISKRDVKRKFPIDVYPVLAGSDAERKWTEFFLQINVKWHGPHGFANGSQKGLVRIPL